MEVQKKINKRKILKKIIVVPKGNNSKNVFCYENKKK